MAMRVSYGRLPYKGQLLVLMLARVAEPLSTTAIQSCMFFQLRHFDPSASDALISSQAGLLFSAKTAAHVCTGVVWGRLADSYRYGRRLVLILSLLACAAGILGYGFSRSFASALAWQMLDGMLNCSISMVRCMTAEMYPEKSYRARALTLLPLSACAGMFLGPILGGFLASDFRKDELDDSLSRYPFAVPSALIASYCTITTLLVLIVLEDNSEIRYISRGSIFTRVHGWARLISARQPGVREREGSNANESEPLLDSERLLTDPLPTESSSSTINPEPIESIGIKGALSFRKMWTANVVSTMLATFLIAGQLGTFANLWPLFLSAPSQSLEGSRETLHFSGGLAMDRRQVAISMSLLGLVGVLLQVVVYPALNDRFGTIRTWRSALWFFPLAFFIAPFSTLAISWSSEPNPAVNADVVRWITVLVVLLVFTAGRTGVTPATSLLINDCTPHPSVRGTIHTIGTVSGNLGRSIFPAIILPIFGYGLQVGITGLGFWCLAALALLTCAMRGLVTEGSNGTEIVLEAESSPADGGHAVSDVENARAKKRALISVRAVDSDD